MLDRQPNHAATDDGVSIAENPLLTDAPIVPTRATPFSRAHCLVRATLAAGALSLVAFLSPVAAQDRGEWELFITFIAPGQEPVSRFYGVMVSEEACHLAGQGLALLVLSSGQPVEVGVTCRRRVSA